MRTAVGFPAIIRAQTGSPASRPNILWVLAEDLGPQLGCYGYPLVRTPKLDWLASYGVRFTRAFVTGPVCSASRSAFNIGLYQTTTGTHHHRSHRKDGYRLPEGVRLISHRLRDAGYFTANVLEFGEGVSGTGKTDFNFSVERPFEGTHWNQRSPGQPFFAQVNFQETHKGPAFKEARRQEDLIDPSKVDLPPYYPDHPVVRDEFANYLDTVNLLDRKAGLLLDALRRDNLLESTVIFFMGDNGRCLLRGKQWLYDAGIHVPLIVHWPGVIGLRRGDVRHDLVTSLDVTATSLMCAGVAPPEPFHGNPLFGGIAPPLDVIVAARDRCDMTVDRIRCVRSRRYKYIRNFMPERPYTQYNRYIAEQYPTLRVMQELFAAGKLNATQSLFMQPAKPPVEFYDLDKDPHEVNNLAGSKQHASRIREASKVLDHWMEVTGDRGREPEPESARTGAY